MNTLKHRLSTSNHPLWLIVTWCLLILFSSPGQATEIKFIPQSPLVEIGKSIVLSVSGTEGEVTWMPPLKGQIQGTGQQVTYLASIEAGVDEVKVADSAGNTGTVRILIPPAGTNPLSLENAVWKVFTNTRMITTLELSEDGKTLWVATNGGLEKRNAQTGTVQKVLTQLDGLPKPATITVLLDDDQGGVWIGTRCEYNEKHECIRRGGLSHCNPNIENVKKCEEILDTKDSELLGNWITVLYPDGQGGIWVGTSDGLAHYNAQKQLITYDLENLGLPSNWVKALSGDNQGGLWVVMRVYAINNGFSESLAYLNTQNEWQLFNNIKGSFLLSDEKSGLWVKNGMEVSYYGGSDLYRYFVITVPTDINTIQRDKQGGTWIANGSELYHSDMPGPWQKFDLTKTSIPSNWISAIQSDNQGGVWVGTLDGLAYCHKDKQNQCRILDESYSGLPDSENDVAVLRSDGNGGIWVGTWWGGLAHRSAEGEWTSYPELPDEEVHAILNDSQIGLWVGTRNEGLFHYTEEKTWQVFNTENSKLPDNQINILLSDNQGGLWIGGWGLSHYSVQTNSWQVFKADNSGLPSNEVYNLISDNQDGLWVGTVDSCVLSSKCVPGTSCGLLDCLEGGLTHYDVKNNKWQRFDQNSSNLLGNSVTELLNDKQDGIWVGTHYGLLRYYNGQWQEFTVESGLPDNDIYALSNDSGEGVWVGTNRGG